MSAREGARAVYEVFETSDAEQVFIGLTSDGHWQRFCEHVGCTDLLDDPRYESNEARVAQCRTLVPLVAELVRRHTKMEMLDLCDRIRVPFAPVATTSDLFDETHLNHTGHMLDTELGDGLRCPLPGLPIELDHRAPGLHSQPLQVGEHTARVLGELGLSEAEIGGLAERGVIRLLA